MLVKHIIVPALILGAGVFGMISLQSSKEETQRPSPQQPARIVNVQTVTLGEVPVRIEAFGRMVSQQPVSLISEVEGLLEQGEVSFLAESRFRKGQVLLRVDDRPVRLQIKGQKSALLNALARALPEIRIEYPDLYPAWQAYFDALDFEGDLQALPQAQNSKIKLFLSRFDVYSLYFNIRDLEILLDKHVIRAPFDGVIASISLRPGATVRSGSQIAQLLNMEQLEVAVEVPADKLAWINLGMAVDLTAEELDQTWQGKVTRIGTSLDEETQTLKVYVEPQGPLNSDSPLFEGMFLQANMTGKTINDAIQVPLRLLYGKNQVFLVENEKLVARQVEVGYRLTDAAIITAGLTPGERMVSEVLQGAVEGMPVQIKDDEEQL